MPALLQRPFQPPDATLVNPLLLSHFTATSCIGRGLDATLDALRDARGGLVPCNFERADLDTWIGAVDGVDEQPVRADLADFECRNNRLAQLGLTQDGFDARVAAAVARYGAARVGVFVGTSTAGILETERAYQRRDPAGGALPADFATRTRTTRIRRPRSCAHISRCADRRWRSRLRARRVRRCSAPRAA